MARSLLVAPAAEDVGLARTCLGLLRALDRSGIHVDYVKPVAQPRADGTSDRSAALVAAVSTLRPPEPLSTAELERQLGEGGLNVVLEKIVAAWAPIYNRSDVVVVEGLKAGPSKLYASALNQALARALDADVLLVGNWPAEPDGVEGLAEQFAIAASGYTSGDTARVVGCVVHGLPAAHPSLVLKAPPPRPARDRRPADRAGSAPAPADRRGAAPAGADLAAGRRHGPRAEPRDPARGRPVPADQGRGGVRPGHPRRPGSWTTAG